MDSEKVMEILNHDAASDEHRRLLEGERVEVRQKERGLRGSWHSGTVVKVKYCRRLVEYDELYTQDGLRRLKETVPLCEEVKSHTPTRRDTNAEAPNPAEGDGNVSSSLKKRGFIRPSPPPCRILSRQDWKRGLLVDAFYNDAWWEGVLLDDVTSDSEELKTKIFFPEEGDELEISVKDLRVSQEWDEASGLWAARGYWFFNDESSLSALKEICVKVKSPVKDLWRQRRFCSPEDLAMQEQRINNQNSTDKTFQTQSLTCDMLKCPWYPVSMEAIGAKLKSIGNHYEKRASTKRGEKCTSVVKFKNTNLDEDRENTFLGAGYDSVECAVQDGCKDSDPLNLLPLAKKKFDVNVCFNEGLTDKARASLRVSSMVERSSRDQCTGESQEECRSADCTIKVDPLFCEDNGNCLRGMNGNNPRKHGAFSADIHLPLKVRVRQARLAAKAYLLSNGWKLDSRLRHRGSRTKYEAVYISPSGSRFFSLAAACRELRPDIEIPSTSSENTGSVLEAYQIAEGLTDTQHLHIQPSGTKQISAISGSIKDIHGSDSAAIPELTDFKCGSPKHQQTTLDFPTEYKEETLEEMRNISLSLEKSTKRKSEGCISSSSEEPKRKRCKGYLKGSRNSTENKGSGVKGGCRMQVLLSCPERPKDQNSCPEVGGLPQFKKSTVLSWLIDKNILKENEPVVYINRKDGQVMKRGKVTREGILCDCCKDIFTLSNFEAHAGSKLHRPSANIFLDNGKSISDCQLEACALQDAKEKKEGIMDVSDDSCGVCGDGGELVLCDHCPSTFHADCIGLTVIPEGDWYCPRCSCGVCGTNQRMDGMDNKMLRCVQCELEYHLSCVQTHSVLPLNQPIQKIWFCDGKCQKIFIGLRQLLGITHSMEGGFSWMLLRAMKTHHSLSQSNLEVMAEHNSKLSVAYDVMRECFVPMIDPRTRINLLSQALYNRRSKVARLNYGGFYTMLLERGDEIITVATIRVHGVKLAEMPLVGTRYQYRRQGMCRRLMHVLEKMLKNVGVEKLILPAVPELLETWISAFGFQQMSVPEIKELSKLHLMTFPGTTLLQKHLVNNTTSSKPDDQPDISKEFYNPEKSSCKSMEEFFSMNCRSLDNNLLEGNMNGDISRINSTMFNYMQELVSDDQDTPELFMPSRTGKPKSQIRYKPGVGSPKDAQTCEEGREDDIYTRVVIGTTRSKRQVKSIRWVADGLRELKDSKLSRRITPVDVNSSKSPVCESGQGQDSELQNVATNYELHDMERSIENVYVRTRRKRLSVSSDTVHYNAASGLIETEDISNWDANKISNYMRLQLSSGEVLGEIKFCPKFYTRRKKSESIKHMQDHSKIHSLHQASVTPLNDNNQEFMISPAPSYNSSLVVEPLSWKGGNSEMTTDNWNVASDSGNTEMLTYGSSTEMLINNSNMIHCTENINLEKMGASSSENADDGNNAKVPINENTIYENDSAELTADNQNMICCIDDSNPVRPGVSVYRTDDIAITNHDCNSEAVNSNSNFIYGDCSAEVMAGDSGGLDCKGGSHLERSGTDTISMRTISGDNAEVATTESNVFSARGITEIKADYSNDIGSSIVGAYDGNVVFGTEKMSSNDSNGRDGNVDLKVDRFCPREILINAIDVNIICSTAEDLADDRKPVDSTSNRNLVVPDPNIACTDININCGNRTSDSLERFDMSNCDANVTRGNESADEMHADYEDSRLERFKLNPASIDEFNISCGHGCSNPVKMLAKNPHLIDGRPDNSIQRFDS